ncbi:MAG: hypothetical protein OEZ00_04655 [Dehalococcoidia bacterium]|nr:hypothetical protein [Dehalococcoidia bacterium]
MLLIDGVKYELWTPLTEDEFERIVKEHTREIFGEESIYIDIKHKLKSKEGTGTIPDGYVITFGDKPQLHIVEIELSSHSYDHIISQITKIITCIKDTSTWNDIARTIRDEITKDEFIAIKAKKAIESGEVYEFLYDRISNLASLAIVIDKNREDVRAGIRNITHREIKMIEFQTFKRVGAEVVHAHLFQSIYEPHGGEGKPPIPGGRYLLSTSELLAKYGDRLSNVKGMTWQQLYDSNTDGNFRYFKVRMPLIELDKKETHPKGG